LRVGFRSGLRSVLCVLSMLVLTACGDDNAEAYSPVGPDRIRDAGARRDAGAGPSPDAGEHDNEIFSGDLYLCGYDDGDAFTHAAAAQADLAIAADERGFALLHHDADGALLITAVPIGELAQSPVRLVRASDAAARFAVAARDVGFLLSWRAGGPFGSALWSRELSSAAHPVVSLSTALAPSPGDGELFALLGRERGYAAVWHDDGGGARALFGAELGADGEPSGDAPELAIDSASAAEDLHLAELGASGAMLAWLEHDSDGRGRIAAQRLDADLSVRGEPVELSRHDVDGSRFDFAGRGASAGLIYGVRDGGAREAIKYLRVDADGTSDQAVLDILHAPGRAVAGSIASFGQGYAVAYRALPSLGVPAPVVRVAFINQFGAIVHEAELGETTEQGGRTAIAATTDGHLLVGWISDWPSGRSTHALALHCPGALVLCGGELK
jgi:hypothetical protein